jgi:hypothetical protein
MIHEIDRTKGVSGSTRAVCRGAADLASPYNPGRLRRGALAALLCLCLCVVLQMLGVRGTLLSRAFSSDLLGTSILEGFFILSAAVQPPSIAVFAAASEPSSFLPLPILMLMLFHPPFP